MREIIFAQTRHWYDSYTDYISLSKLAGFKQCYIDEIDLEKDVIYVASPINGEFRPHIDNWRDKKKKNCTICYWNLERPCGNGGADSEKKRTKYHVGNVELIDKRYADYVWISDKGLAESHKHSKIHHMVLGSHPDLRETKVDLPKSYDFSHLSYLSHRRSLIIDRLRVNGIRVAPTAWKTERDNILNKSKFMVGVHQDEDHFIEPLRFSLAAAYKLPYISEQLWNSLPLIVNEDFVQVDHTNLIKFITEAIHNYDSYIRLGENLHQKLCYEHEFGKMVRNFCSSQGLS